MKKLLLLDPSQLHEHEAVDDRQVRRIKAVMEETGQFHPPLLVDFETKVILDGHHRYRASKELGCKRIPCYCVGYLADESIVVKSWRPDVNVTKQQVLDMGVSDGVFPLKTTRHIYDLPGSLKPIATDELMKAEQP